jgi:hypothetical protein
LSRKDGSAGDPYPLANRIAGDVVSSWSRPEAAKTRAIREPLKQLEAAHRARAETHTDAYNLNAAAQRSLLDALVSGGLSEEEVVRLGDAFERSLSHGATARERDSMRTRFRFFRTMATEMPEEKREKLIARLEALEERVRCRRAGLQTCRSACRSAGLSTCLS